MKVLVIGVAFVDVKGFPFFKYDAIGTNKGNVVIKQGGAARNVAEDLAKLGAEVNFPVMLDGDAFGNEVRTRLTDAGVDVSLAPRTDGNGIGMWLAVFDEKGNLAGSISKMPEAEPMERLFDEKGAQLVADADMIVIEYDLSEKITDQVMALALEMHKPIYVIVGNMTVILKRRELLAKTDCIIMNEIEAGKLLDIKLTGRAPGEVLQIVLEKGREMQAKRMVVTLGGDGCVYSDFITGEFGHIPARKVELVDTTGAGDSFLSAAVLALSKGYSLADAVRFGAKIAAIVISITENACPVLGDAFFDSYE